MIGLAISIVQAFFLDAVVLHLLDESGDPWLSEDGDYLLQD